MFRVAGGLLIFDFKCNVPGDEDNSRPLVISAESGCGKTSIMAKASSLVSGWVEADAHPIILLRFLGKFLI